MDCPLTERTGIMFGEFFYGILDVLVVLFWTTRTGGLFFALRYEAVAASAGQVAFGEVELEAPSHLSLNVVDFCVSEKVGTLGVGYDVHSIPVFDNVGSAGFVEFEAELIACAASRFYEDAEGQILVVDLLQIVLDLRCRLIGYAYCHTSLLS